MNAPLSHAPRVEPFFFDADPGTRFSLYHAPAPHMPARGAILYVHPFAEELNTTRRTAALQARQFAGLGFAVLQIDLFGCGDSCGDFHAARWDIWQRDLRLAMAWLAERDRGPRYLWGVRLGGLLALDFACTAPVDGIILWQPFISGRHCIDQFLRQRPAAHGFGAACEAADGSAGPRAALAACGVLEVGGYALSAELARAIDPLEAAAMALPSCHVHWFASGAPAPAGPSARVAALAQRWQARGVTLDFHPVAGLPFWCGEAAVCHAMLAATGAVFHACPP